MMKGKSKNEENYLKEYCRIGKNMKGFKLVDAVWYKDVTVYKTGLTSFWTHRGVVKGLAYNSTVVQLDGGKCKVVNIRNLSKRF